ncbi:hypothetical protein EMPS_10057 [Entomortierella parvispora]|uniref:Uncharacterized protein n=1 Tax=Entomortierella parvispora TaxID=205924 RepID=A0A9P3HJJ4_9FUNG|nr:hypothetical protein EMPS_10057 [Entomortierella parvispora]
MTKVELPYSAAMGELNLQIDLLTRALIDTRTIKQQELSACVNNNSHPLVLAIYMHSISQTHSLRAYQKALAEEIQSLFQERRKFTQSLEMPVGQLARLASFQQHPSSVPGYPAADSPIYLKE